MQSYEGSSNTIIEWMLLLPSVYQTLPLVALEAKTVVQQKCAAGGQD